jgi:uncharacterized protein DUF6084
VVDLAFECLDIAPERYGVAPTLIVKLRITESTGARVHAIALRCQIRIDPARRQYTDREAELLLDVFGDRGRWGETLKPMQFAYATAMVPSFTGSADIEVPVPVSYDLEVATGKFLHALDADPVALTLLFSGTVFDRGATGFAVGPVSWQAEAAYRLPASVWTDLMDQYFPDSGWLMLRRGTLDELIRYKSAHGFATWDETIATLVERAPEVTS